MRQIDSNLDAYEHVGGARRALVAMALAAASSALTGCISDPDCGVCDPDNLILETIAAANYAGKEINVLSPECVGDRCPEPLTSAKVFVNTIGRCEESDGATGSARGVEEWCKISPLIVGEGINFIFNNLLDPTSVELVRKQLTNPQLFEVYDWKTRILKIKGPITRYNGDFIKGTGSTPDVITRSVNLSCIQNLAALGVPFGHNELAAGACDRLADFGGGLLPLRTQLDEEIKARSGATEWRGESCDTPESGADTCCTACDFELSVNTAKYGLVDASANGADRSSWLADGRACDTMGDKYATCRDFAPFVDRKSEDARRYKFNWNGVEIESPIPIQDKLRETHPDFRPQGVEQKTVKCETRSDCTSGAGLPGSDCVGRLVSNGSACSVDNGDDACVERTCVAEWFVTCKNIEGLGGRCVDTRFDDKGAMSCFRSGNRRLANLDADDNKELSAAEVASLCSGAPCDPYFPARAGTVPRYDRKATLPEQARDCVCTDQDVPAYCEEVVNRLCKDSSGKLIEELRDRYATRFVAATGGVIYDPAVKGVAYRPADLGAVGRSYAETCAATRGNIGRLNIKDGWRANDSFAESDENFDRAMCSSSQYEIEFATPSGGGQFIKDKVGNTLEGRRTYRFETPDFHIVPGSGFPTSNLRIGACNTFEVRFSNKYDLSPGNLRKVQLVEIPEEGAPDVDYPVVAGGADCTSDPDEADSKPPCLTINVRSQNVGGINVSINPKDFGQVLSQGKTYRMRMPGLRRPDGTYYDSMDEFRTAYAADPVAGEASYKNAFWDACGMPLILGGASSPDYFYDFRVSTPKAKEDKDGVLGVSLTEPNMCLRIGDGVQLSCDNAANYFNPEQLDTDLDGFGDVYDLCPTVPTNINTADSDRDGVGNECDSCSRQASVYNKDAVEAGVPTAMLVRANPNQSDWDEDGVGDVCDNCVKTANCGTFGPGNPFVVGDIAPVDNPNICQTDVDTLKMVGDACAPGGVPTTYEGAAGPVGFGNDDDFDGDGLRNAIDYCPRQPIERVGCAGDGECGGSKCTEGVCNHPDSDGDQVGDICDTCPFDSNPSQIADGGMQEDDEDGDFVGRSCETNSSCYKRPDPRPFSFYTVSANGWCCTTQLAEISKVRIPHDLPEVVFDEAGVCEITRPALPLTVDCPEGDPSCRQIPDSALARPGLVALPPGCQEALDAAGDDLKDPQTGFARRLGLDDFQGMGGVNPEGALWSNMCFLPQFDQDFDGVGDGCDLCPFAFDKDNQPFINANGRLFPDAGRFCNGDYDVEKIAACYEIAQPECQLDEGGTTGGETEGTSGTTG